jgi:hypothetical protein
MLEVQGSYRVTPGYVTSIPGASESFDIDREKGGKDKEQQKTVLKNDKLALQKPSWFP